MLLQYYGEGRDGVWPADSDGESISFREIWAILELLIDNCSLLAGWRV